MEAPLAAFLLCFLLFVVSSASGKPLQTDATRQRVFAFPGEDVVLPCLSASGVVEWSKVEGASRLTVHVVRNGEELEKEKDSKYLRRTAVMKDGSLKLLNVTLQDAGAYSCVRVRAHTDTEVNVTLVVVEVPDVSVALRRTPAKDAVVCWESSGWAQEPRLSLLLANGTKLSAHPTVSVGPDGLFSVRAELDLAAAKGNVTIVCRVEIPRTSVVKENRVHIADDFLPVDADLCRHVLSAFIALAAVAVVLALALFVVLFFVPIKMIEKLRTLLKPRIDVRQVGVMNSSGRSSSTVNQQLLNEYGDITQVSTSGSSSINVKGHILTGVEASHELAKADLKTLMTYKEKLIRVGNKLGVHPAVIAAIISRQSRFGDELGFDGYGQGDSSSYGLMQINKHYHAIKGGPYSEEHLDQGVTVLIQLIKTMRQHKQNWTKEQQLKGALACYIAGEDKVLPLAYDQLDSVTPRGDFASDVVARAQWFAHNAFSTHCSRTQMSQSTGETQ